MTLKTRRPTGVPPWPMTLVAGAEKAGKSYSCAEASASDLIGRTFWIGIGEDDPDEYGAIPGARFEIVVHDGTYRSLQTALDECAAEPDTDGKPNLIVVDSGTRLWDLLSDMAQAEANQRAAAKAQRSRQPAPTDDVDISMDLWNTAKNRWQHCLGALRRHRGPSLITARLEQTTAMVNGRPTSDKVTKIKAEKNLPFDVGVVVELPTRGEAHLTAVRSLRLSDRAERRGRLNDFSIEQLWRDLGCAEGTSSRTFVSSDGRSSLEAEDRLVTERDELLSQLRGLTRNPADVAARWQREHGHALRDTTDLDGLRALVVTHGGRPSTSPTAPARSGESGAVAAPSTTTREDAEPLPDAPAPSGPGDTAPGPETGEQEPTDLEVVQQAAAEAPELGRDADVIQLASDDPNAVGYLRGGPKVTAAQLRMLGALWSKFGLSDEDRRAYTETLIGHDLDGGTTKSLTKREASFIVDGLTKIETLDQLDDAIASRQLAQGADQGEDADR